MRSRIVGGIALLLGLMIVAITFISNKPIEWKPFLGGLLFIGMGGYYLFTGKKAATMGEFIAEGKLSHDSSADDFVEKAIAAPDVIDRQEALRSLGKRKGLGEAQMKDAELAAHAQAAKQMEEMFDRIAKEQGLTEEQRKELEAPLRAKLAAMLPQKNG
jgi:hypothetical protein